MGLALLAAGLTAWSALALLPVGPGLRGALQPGLAEALDGALAVAGVARHPLALDPSGALLTLGFFGALWVLCLGAASAVWNRRRARTVAMAIVGTAVGLAVLGLAQRISGASHIWWVSSLPQSSPLLAPSQLRFFGTFVSVNHAGAFLGACLPLAAALALHTRASARALGLAGLVALGLGLWATGSRGGVLAAAVGLVTLVCVRLGRTGAWIGLGVLAATLAVLGIGGPFEVAHWLAAYIDPESAHVVEQGWTAVDGGRLALWSDAWGAVRAAPWMGVGGAGFDDVYLLTKTSPGFTVATHAHLEPLQVLVEHGALGLVGWIGVAFLFLRSLGRAARADDSPKRRWLVGGFAGALTALVAAGLVDFPFRAGAHAVLAALCLGAVVGLTGDRLKTRSDAGPRPPAQVRTRLNRVGTGMGALAALALVLWSLGAVAGMGTYGWADRAEDAGDDAVAQGQLDAARAHYAQAVARRPVNRAALQKLARVQIEAGELDPAVTTLTAAAGIYPTLPWPWRDLARLHLQRGDLSACYTAWSRMLALDIPGRAASGRRYVAEALSATGALGLDDPMIQALTVLPPRADRWRQAAEVVALRGDRETAKALFQEAALLDPAERVPYAVLLVRWGEAQAALDQLAQVEDHGCRSSLVQADASLMLDRCDEATEAAELARIACPSHDLHLRRTGARVRLCSGDARGLAVLQRLLDEDPTDMLARHALTADLVARGRFDEALPHLEWLEREDRIHDRERAWLEGLRAGRPVVVP